MNQWFRRVIISIISGLLISFIIYLSGSHPFGTIFWGTSILTSICTFFIILTYEWAGKSRLLFWILLLGFLFRFGFGIITSIGLPSWGYDEETQNNGYLFQDAYFRDTQAWELASSNTPIHSAFGDQFFSDQYGGLLAISAIVYRFFTPSAHAQLNIILVATFISILGIPFLWRASRDSIRIQKISVIVYTFYPDAIFFSSSQMREPFLIGLSAILFYLLNENERLSKRRLYSVFIVSLALFMINARISVFIVAIMAIWFILTKIHNDFLDFGNKKFIIGFSVVIFIVGLIGTGWFLEVSKWDAYLAVQSSGWLQAIFERIGNQFRLPFLTIYGFLQPILPAAIMEPSITFWKILGIIRSSGWVFLLPLVFYGFVFAVRQKGMNRIKWLTIWLFVIFWIFLSSLRAGGDLWDNPRYRLALFVPMVVLVSNALNYAIETHDHWLLRIYLAEGVYLLFFLQWYISRYTNIFGKLDFLLMVVFILLIIGLIIVSGFIYEHKIKRQNQEKI